MGCMYTKSKLKHFHSKINEKPYKLIKMNVFEIILIYKKNRRLVLDWI